MSDFYYLNARLRAMRGRLLTRAEYESILLLPDLPALAAYLLDTPYGRSIEAVGEATSPMARLEEGLRRNFSETLTQLFAISSEEVQEAVRILLGYWDVYNLKTILRGKTAGLPAEKILPSLVPTGFYDEAALEELCRPPDLRAVVDLLITWRDPYGHWLSGVMKEYHEPKDLFLLETALDRFYFERAFTKLDEVRLVGSDRDALFIFMRFLVDRTNLMTALQAVEERIAVLDLERYFLPGGRVYTEHDITRLMSAQNLQEALRLAMAGASRFLSQTFMRDIGEPGRGISLLSLVERQLDRTLLRKMRGLMRVDPLGVGAAVAYLLDKIREITNLRMILRGRLVNLPEPELSQLLILEY